MTPQEAIDKLTDLTETPWVGTASIMQKWVEPVKTLLDHFQESKVIRRVETGQYIRREGAWVWVPHDTPKATDVTPDPLSWPECPTCHTAYVLRLAHLIAGGHTWVWQRDCKHKVEPKLNNDASAFVPECPECGAAPGQAHDPTCKTRNPA